MWHIEPGGIGLLQRTRQPCRRAAAGTDMIRVPVPPRPSVIRAFALWVSLTALAGVAHAEEDPGSILLATTTSVRDSGLLDTLVPVFRERSGIHVRVVAVGTCLEYAGHGRQTRVCRVSRG